MLEKPRQNYELFRSHRRAELPRRRIVLVFEQGGFAFSPSLRAIYAARVCVAVLVGFQINANVDFSDLTEVCVSRWSVLCFITFSVCCAFRLIR